MKIWIWHFGWNKSDKLIFERLKTAECAHRKAASWGFVAIKGKLSGCLLIMLNLLSSCRAKFEIQIMSPTGNFQQSFILFCLSLSTFKIFKILICKEHIHISIMKGICSGFYGLFYACYIRMFIIRIILTFFLASFKNLVSEIYKLATIFVEAKDLNEFQRVQVFISRTIVLILDLFVLMWIECLGCECQWKFIFWNLVEVRKENQPVPFTWNPHGHGNCS